MDIFDPETFDEDVTMRIVLSAKEIPDGETVTKKTGEKEYILRHTIKIFAPQGKKGEEKQVPMVIAGYFLISPNGDINQIVESTELMWRATASDLYYKLQRAIEYEIPQ